MILKSAPSFIVILPLIWHAVLIELLIMQCTRIDFNEKMITETKKKNPNVDFIQSDIGDFILM